MERRQPRRRPGLRRAHAHGRPRRGDGVGAEDGEGPTVGRARSGHGGAAARSIAASSARNNWPSVEGWNDEQLVFVQEDGTRIHPTRFSHWFTAHAQRAGLPRIRLHDLRHSYATAALSAGIPAKVVSERLGHANVSITLDTYSHVLPALQEDAANAVATLILGT